MSLRTMAGVAVKSYSLKVQDRDTRQVIYDTGTQLLPDGRDLSQSPLRVGLKFDQPGTFLIQVLGASVPDLEDLPIPGSDIPELFWAGIYTVTGDQQIDALLLPVPPELDQDRDHFPDAVRWLAQSPDAAALYQQHTELLDCLDQDPPPGDLVPLRLRAYDIHPLAKFNCAVMVRGPSTDPTTKPALENFDNTCGGQPRPCLDQDHDGDPENTDCDDHDPRRFHGNPRPRNCCQCTDRQSCATNHAKLDDLTLCTPPRCNTTFDYDCTGRDVNCFRDDDCDGYSPDDPVPSQRDCDDNDPNVHPGAHKICPGDAGYVDGKDWACDGNPKGGCVDCDLDGDGYERMDPAGPDAHCPDQAYRNAHKANLQSFIDCDDDDRGVFPGSSTTPGQYQLKGMPFDASSTSYAGTVIGAMRGLCRNTHVWKGTGDAVMSGQPQDNDCDGQMRKGCPPAMANGKPCDMDGDGFPGNNDPACNPNHLPLDCNDNDPTTFPGAPPKCTPDKDGQIHDHNCDNFPDRCDVDQDGDGYDAMYDCDDTRASIHPFAQELCNGIDDDCDGLIDEQNPDSTGKPLIETNATTGLNYIMSCDDSGVGDCAQKVAGTGGYTGRCVCTGVKPNSMPDDKTRAACPGEKDDSSITAKCFGAYQALGHMQTCDADHPHDEDCDGRTDAPDGKNLMEYGQQCGLDAGQCKHGTVVGCDRSKLNHFSNDPSVRPASAQGLPVKDAKGNIFDEKGRFLVCNGDAVYPLNEVCNGQDDDCDGLLPGDSRQPRAVPPAQSEIDFDHDLYMACTGCDPKSATFSSAVKGCGDCNDMNNAVYPGAPELCDGLDNACKYATDADWQSHRQTDDGKMDCAASAAAPGNMCCTLAQNATMMKHPMCIDLSQDKYNCGTCDNTCDPTRTDRCLNSMCMCGNNSGPCDPKVSDSCKNGCLCSGGPACSAKLSDKCDNGCKCGTGPQCGQSADNCTGGACMCGAKTACSPSLGADTCTAGVCVCGNMATACNTKTANNCMAGACMCGNTAACSGAKGADTCTAGACVCGNMNTACSAKTADSCTGGACMCGNAAACDPKKGADTCTNMKCVCGNANAACDPTVADNCTGGACMCGKVAACNAVLSDSCTAGLCMCGKGLQCGLSADSCTNGTCMCGNKAACDPLQGADTCTNMKCVCGNANAACDPTVADNCTSGTCMCGNKAACDPNSMQPVCKNGSCVKM